MGAEQSRFLPIGSVHFPRLLSHPQVSRAHIDCVVSIGLQPRGRASNFVGESGPLGSPAAVGCRLRGVLGGTSVSMGGHLTAHGSPSAWSVAQPVPSRPASCPLPSTLCAGLLSPTQPWPTFRVPFPPGCWGPSFVPPRPPPGSRASNRSCQVSWTTRHWASPPQHESQHLPPGSSGTQDLLENLEKVQMPFLLASKMDIQGAIKPWKDTEET